MLWAPRDNPTLAQVAFALQALSVSSDRDLTLHLVVPHDPYPGCDQPGSILDLWWHGLLADKWRSVVASVEFLRQPTRCVFSGAISPMHHLKYLAIFTLSTSAGTAIPMSVVQWRPTLVKYDDGPTILVDCEEAAEMRAQKTLTTAVLQ